MALQKFQFKLNEIHHVTPNDKNIIFDALPLSNGNHSVSWDSINKGRTTFTFTYEQVLEALVNNDWIVQK